MSSDLLSTSITGLRVSQSALSTTGHNISNAGVEGFNRQRSNAITNPAAYQGGAFVGSGASVESVERIANSFITEQLRKDTSLQEDLDVYYTNISQLDNLLADFDTGLTGALESFFASVQNGADDPTSIPGRQLIVSEAENLADRFNSIYSRFEAIESGLDEAFSAAVEQINSLAENIATLNLKISDAIGIGGDAAPNDLLDQREQALKELSELISIQVYDNDNSGQVNIIIGSGQNLVTGADVRSLSAVASASDVSKLDVVFNDNSRNLVITDFISGGELGGLIRFDSSIMSQTYNELGRLAVSVAHSFNEVHQQGINLENEFGGNFFYDVNAAEISTERVIANVNNAPPQDRVLKLEVTDIADLEVSDYSVSFDEGGLYVIERLSDGAEVATGLLGRSFPESVQFDGLELIFEQGSFQGGDQFTLSPYKTAARDFSAVITDPLQLAFGGPLTTEASLGNSGTGVIAGAEVLSLVDQNGDALPLLASQGELDPPLIIRFTSETTYDVLDNSDPGNPVHLEPPIRNRHFIPGVENAVFPSDIGETLVTTAGDMIGIPEGREAVTQAAILHETPLASAPDFLLSDFSATSNRFSFDVVVSNTVSGANNGTYAIEINHPAITDSDALLNAINSQLTGSDAVAYIADNGTLAFRLNTSGFGDLTIQNYNADPDGGGDLALAGQANNLLGFDVENTSFTTIANADGITGDGFTTNGYPSEVITITRAAEYSGTTAQVENIYTDLNASARELADALNNVQGVSANAFNAIELSNYQVSGVTPLQVYLNGESLLEYDYDPATAISSLSPGVPDPLSDTHEFNEYLASAINSNKSFQDKEIYAVSTTNPITGASGLKIVSSLGDDLDIALTASQGQSIDVGDEEGENLKLVGAGNSVTSSIVVGGRLDVSLAEGLSLGSFPPESMLFGNTADPNLAKETYRGIQVNLSGKPDQGDDFVINFNVDGQFDNRNALQLVELQTRSLLSGGEESFSDSYGTLIERIGIETSSAKINADASKQVMGQTEAMRNSISGVNLDEEAANLIRFQQMYSANAQVISMARDLFDTLIGSFA